MRLRDDNPLASSTRRNTTWPDAYGKSAPRTSGEAKGPIELKADYLVIHLPLGINGATEVVTHLPPITVEGGATMFPDVVFKLEKHTRLITIAGNC
jgi:hypothetical protein